jgi:hypothetical protein
MHYGFADTAASYLYTDQNDHPSKLTLPPDHLQSMVEAAAADMHVTLSSIDVFNVLGSDAIVVASADSLEQVAMTSNPLFGDPGNLEGACLILLDPAGRVLTMWSYSTGLQAGHGDGGSATGGGPLH